MWRLSISPRSSAPWVAVLALACLAIAGIRADSWWTTAPGLLLPLVVTGVLPGFLAFLWFRPTANATLFDVVAVSTGLSLCLAQLLTFFVIGFGFPAELWTFVFPLAIGAVAVGFFFLGNARPGLRIIVRTADIWLLGALSILAIIVYVGGNHWFMSWINEDHIHLSIIRRFIELPSPGLDDLYFVNGITYSYPFPGVHFFYALTSAVSGLDPIFVYDKMGVYWSLTALATLYSFTSTVFRSRRVGAVTLALAIALVLLGPFARVPGFYWGQLTPVPHVSDVAMNVILPLQLLFAVRFIDARNAAAMRFYLVATILMMVMLGAVHPREFVQFVVYMSVAAVVLLAFRHPRRRRGVATLIVSVLIFAAYYSWHKENVANIASVVSQGQRVFLDFVAGLTVADLFSPLRPYAWGIRETMFYGLGGLMMAAAPVAAVAFRRYPFVWMMMLSIVIYLAIIRTGALSIPFIYVTYDEVLTSTMRNIIFFCYVMLGGGAYWLGQQLLRLIAEDTAWRRLLTAVSAGFSIGVVARFIERAGIASDALADLQVAVFLLFSGVALVAMYVLNTNASPHPFFRRIGAFVDGNDRGSAKALSPHGRAAVIVALALPFALLVSRPGESPLRQALREPGPMSAENALDRYYPLFSRATFGELAREVVESDVCRPEKPAVASVADFRVPPTTAAGTILWCLPSTRFVKWLRDNIRPEAVMMLNPANAFQAMPFYRGQLAVPAPVFTLRAWATVLPSFAQAVETARARHGGMPVYNRVESAEERFSILRELGASHLLVDPMYWSEVMSAVSRRPDLFKVIHEERKWAVIELSAANP